jgi:DNA polymerase-3 subunit delta
MLTGNLRDGLRVVAGLKRMDTPVPLLLGALLRELKVVEAYRLAMRGGEQESMVFRRLNIWQNRQHTVRTAARRLGTLKLFTAYKMLSLIDRQSKGRAAGDPWQSVDKLMIQLAL